MLKCRDFDVKSTQAFVGYKNEPIESVLERVNAWIDSEQIKVLTVETVKNQCAWSNGEYRIRVWYDA